MTETGWIPYGLSAHFCEECGQAKSYRMWPGVLTGCKACDEVVTRHRCTGRPDLGALDVGASWTCPDCDSKWTVREGEEPCPDCCADCGHMVTRRDWSYVPGKRIGTAPRHDPQSFTPFRNRLAR